MHVNVAPSSSDPASGADGPATGIDAPDLRVFVFALFFIFGGITSLNDIIIPKLQELFTLDHATSMLVQSAFFVAYALFSIPAAAIVRRLGYLRTASIGLVTMTAGCLLFIPPRKMRRSACSCLRCSCSALGSRSCRSSPTR